MSDRNLKFIYLLITDLLSYFIYLFIRLIIILFVYLFKWHWEPSKWDIDLENEVKEENGFYTFFRNRILSER